jgi:hypothetical protein
MDVRHRQLRQVRPVDPSRTVLHLSQSPCYRIYFVGLRLRQSWRIALPKDQLIEVLEVQHRQFARLLARWAFEVGF